ncbi:MAG: hypothetical protein IPN62_06780 [Flavobacteriales bacterium]|nr:hypothetical protein [Flavobacteriales bacterium]
MSNVKDMIRGQFIAELKSSGDTWRICRKGTLVDFIRLNFFHYAKNRDKKYLIAVFNDSMKILLLRKLEAIEPEGSLEEIAKRFNQEHHNILKQFDIIMSELTTIFDKYASASFYDLNQKIGYIKVLNELEIDSYNDDIFKEIMGITYAVLEL